MHLEETTLQLLKDSLKQLDSGFVALPPNTENPAPPPDPRLATVMTEVATKLQDNYPYFHPLYAGQMLKPPHPIARAAYALATWINPNNHALDGGRASSALEKEAVAQIAAMFGWSEHLGHLCGGGTMANLEALWVAGQLNPGKKIVASDQSHYTHNRISAVLQLPFAHVPTDNRGRMDPIALEKMLAAGDIGCVVATEGTTGTGSVDPLPEILRLRDRYGFRLHVDAAYGGYFTLASNLAVETRASFDLIGRADSIVLDPHKHGLQPYGCGCVLFRDPASRRDLQTRIAVHLFHFFGSSPRRNQPGMFAPRRFRRSALGHATPAAAGAGRGIRRKCSKLRAMQQCNSRNVWQMTSAGCCRSRQS